MDTDYNEEANVPLRQSRETTIIRQSDVTGTARPTRSWHNLLVVATGLAVVIFVAEICVIAYKVKSINAKRNEIGSNLGDSYKNNSPQTQSSVTWEKCNRTSLCPVIRQDNYVALLKLMHGMKWQHFIRSTNKNPLKSPIRVNSDHFIISDCRGDSLRWMGDVYGRESESNGSVTIRENGMYGIYNAFTLIRSLQCSTDNVNIVHRVHLKTSAGNRGNVLFEQKIVLCGAESESFDTSTFFDFVYLREGDRVFPTISNTSFIYDMQRASRWGVFNIK